MDGLGWVCHCQKELAVCVTLYKTSYVSQLIKQDKIQKQIEESVFTGPKSKEDVHKNQTSKPNKEYSEAKTRKQNYNTKKLHMEYKENLALKEGKTHIKLTLKIKEKKHQNETRKRQQRKTITQDSQ